MVRFQKFSYAADELKRTDRLRSWGMPKPVVRRFMQLTNAFSNKVENHTAAVGLHFRYYNFCRVHRTLRDGAGISSHVWSLLVIGLLDAADKKAA